MRDEVGCLSVDDLRGTQWKILAVENCGKRGEMRG
jgi:hypothetical protein